MWESPGTMFVPAQQTDRFYQEIATGLMALAMTYLGSAGNKKEPPQEGDSLFGAGYGNRTRDRGLGSDCFTIKLTLRDSGIIAKANGKFNRFLSSNMVRYPIYLYFFMCYNNTYQKEGPPYGRVRAGTRNQKPVPQ